MKKTKKTLFLLGLVSLVVSLNASVDVTGVKFINNTDQYVQLTFKGKKTICVKSQVGDSDTCSPDAISRRIGPGYSWALTKIEDNSPYGYVSYDFTNDIYTATYKKEISDKKEIQRLFQSEPDPKYIYYNNYGLEGRFKSGDIVTLESNDFSFSGTSQEKKPIIRRH
ncbi:hypothetical protein A3F66_01610 [candidate division TM6 bacterium RIFCSPHIGHO2_12_FULL_32_22]|nr:MAG: hypothetical protein A3F66_01610 [candidate division TM6 bacterium RIFCSPHIGHO2_12_FULL_32_22]